VAALFPHVDGGVIKNIGLINPQVEGGDLAGGLVGHLESGRVENSFVRGGRVSGGRGAGGLVGKMSGGEVKNSYAAVQVIADEKFGGLIGSASGGEVTGSFWEKNASGQSSSAGGIKKTARQLRELTTFVDAGWDIQITEQQVNDGYPYLSREAGGWLLSVSTGDEQASGLSNLIVGPNPFRPNDGRASTGRDRLYFGFNSSSPGPFVLEIYTLTGRLVYSEQTSRDPYGWDLRNNSGQRVSSGYYLYRVEERSTGDMKTGKLAIVR